MGDGRYGSSVAAVDLDDDATDVDLLCPGCRAQAVAAASAHLHGLIITFVCVGGADLPWTAIVRRGSSLLGSASGHTQEDALFDVINALRERGVLPR